MLRMKLADSKNSQRKKALNMTDVEPKTYVKYLFLLSFLVK